MLNLDRVGRYLSKIEDSDDRKLNNKIVSVNSDEKLDEDVRKSYSRISLPSGKFQQIPNPDTEREILYITGASGSGKSTYCCKYINQYKKLYKDRDIYVFSALKDDESLDKIEPKRIRIDNTLITDPIKVEDFKDSLVVFDDIDVISDKKQREAVYNILNQILEIGRHNNISCLITNHLATAGKDTRRVLNECHSITYFPHSGSARQLNYLLTEYLGLDKKDISKIKKLKTRWATIYKNYPQIVMCERDMWILAEDE